MNKVYDLKDELKVPSKIKVSGTKITLWLSAITLRTNSNTVKSGISKLLKNRKNLYYVMPSLYYRPVDLIVQSTSSEGGAVIAFLHCVYNVSKNEVSTFKLKLSS